MSQPETQTRTSGADGGGDEYALARAHAEGVRALGYEFLTHEISLAILQRYLPAAVAALAAPAPKGGTEGIAVIRQAATAGHFRIRCKEREEGADPDAGMVWPIEIELPCINGLSCWFALGNLYSPDAAAQGYTDGALSDDLARAFADHITGSLASPPPPAGGAGGGSGDLGALSAGALTSNAADRLLAVQHPKYFSLHVVGWEFSDAEEGIRLVREALATPTPDLGAQGEPVADDRYAVLKTDHRRRIQALGAAISLRDWFGVEKAHAEIRDAFDRPDIYDPTFTDNMRSQNKPAAWAYEYLASDGWQRALWWVNPSELPEYKDRPERHRNIEPLFKQAPAAPRSGSGAIPPCPHPGIYDQGKCCGLYPCEAAAPRSGSGVTVEEIADEDDAEINRILALSEDEVRAELIADGRDPDELLRKQKLGLNGLMRLAADRTRWRSEAESWRRVAERLEEEKVRLREALKPFAAILANGEPVGPIPRGLLDRTLTRQDLRRATAAFSAPAQAHDARSEGGK